MSPDAKQTLLDGTEAGGLRTGSAARLALHRADGRFPGFLVAEVELAQRELEDELERLGVPATESLLVGLLEGLTVTLDDLCVRSLITSFQAQRTRPAGVGYRDFDAALTDPGRRAEILRHLPELDRLMALAHRQWLRHCRWVLRTAVADETALRERWGIGGALCEIRLGEGDTHRRGRSVSFITWEDGTRLVLKPSAGHIRAVVDGLLQDIDPDGTCFGRLLPESLLREDHEWQVFETPARFGRAAAAEYFRRFGRASALLYALGANDLHRENVIATAGGPVLVDTETLTSLPPVPPASGSTAHEMLAHDDERGILRTLLYPARYLGARMTVDLSALGVPSAAARVSEGIAVVGEGSDAIRFSRTEVPLPQNANAVFDAEGSPWDPRTFAEEILSGYEEAIERLRARPEAIEPAVRNAPDFRFRHVFRATWLYARLLEASTHPSRLGREADRETTLNLLSPPARGRPDELRSRIREAEIDALRHLDIPFFEVAPDGQLYADGTTAVGTLDERPREIICRWWHDVLARPVSAQLRKLRLSLDAAADDAVQHWAAPAAPPALYEDLGVPGALPPEVLAGDAQSSSWQTTVQFQHGLYLSPVTLALYEGGGRLLSAYETSGTDRAETGGTVQRVVSGALAHPLPESGIDAREILYSPWTGAFADAVTGVELSLRGISVQHDAAAAQFARAFADLPELLDELGQRHTGEMLNGSGGTFTALNRYRALWWDGRRYEGDAERLVEAFSAVTERLPAVLSSEEPGWAHGWIGRAQGLAECLDLIRWVTGEAMERSASRLTDWIDSELPAAMEAPALRDARTLQTWCRGAAGAAPALHRTLQLLGPRRSGARDSVHALADALVAAPPADDGDLSLCHGAAGTVLSLALLGSSLGRPDLLREARSRRDAFLRRSRQQGWTSGLGRSPGAEGFFVGRAGWDLVSAWLDGSPEAEAEAKPESESDAAPGSPALPLLLGGGA